MSPHFERHDRPSEATLANPGSTSANVPLLSDVEEIAIDDGEETPETPSEEKKALPGAEYKVALSHFMVSSDHSASLSALIDLTEDLFIFDQE